jgi:hypothetical protein
MQLDLNEPYVYVVSEGEQYHGAFIVHAVFTTPSLTEEYAEKLTKAVGGVRWPNVYIHKFILNVPGHILDDLQP